MVLDRSLGGAQRARDLPVAVTAGHQSKDLHLPPRRLGWPPSVARVLRAKARTTRGPAVDIAWAALLAGSAAATAAYGFATRNPLFLAFSTIGLINGSGELLYWLRRPTVPVHWWLAHMGNMLGAGVAATIAFAIAGGRRLGLPGDSLLTWLGPTAIGLPVILLWVAYYRRRFSSRAASMDREQTAAMQAVSG